MLNIGIIGCGIVADYGHLPTVKASQHWNLLAAAEVNAERLAAVQKKFEPQRAFNDYRELLKLPGLDAVAIATHADTHHAITLAALERGLHVLCEKPMAGNLPQCQEMVDAAARARRILAVNFNTRSGAIYREVKRLIGAGSVGTVRVVRIVYDWSAHQWQPLERMENFMRNGGPIVDSGVHFFEGVRWFTGQEYASIEAQGVVLPPYEHPQHVIATCLMSGGAIALVEAGWLYCKRSKDRGQLFTLDIIGDEGAISYDSHSMDLRIYAKSATEIRKFEDMGKHFEVVYDAFAESIQKGKLLELASGLDGLRATEAAYKALASCHTKSRLICKTASS